MGIYTYYIFDLNIKHFVKVLMTLLYVKKDKIIERLNELKCKKIFLSVLLPLYDYFYVNYIFSKPGTRFPVVLWNCEEIINNEIPKTYNAIEGWHNVFIYFWNIKVQSCTSYFEVKGRKIVVHQRILREISGEAFYRKKYVMFKEALYIFF